MRRILIIGLGALFLFLVPGLWPNQSEAAGANETTPDHENNQLVVKLNPPATIAEINAAYGTVTIETLLSNAGIHLLQVPTGESAIALAVAMAEDRRLRYAELNYIGSAPEANSRDIYAWPDEGAGIQESETARIDPRDLYGWAGGGADDARYHTQPAIHRLQISQAQETSDGTGVVVAVLDTGIDREHPEFASRLTQTGYDFIDDDPTPEDTPNDLDDDGDGFIDEVAGHGTHVAGIVHLVAPQAQIMPLRVLDSDGQGNSFVIAEAMLYAVQHGADVINLSLGSPVPSVFLQDVVDQVTAAGVVVVAAAGNLNEDSPQYPAATACVLAVTSVGPGSTKSTYANFGPWVDVAAPGDRVYSSYPDNGYAWWSGTSMATPFVSGQVALLRSANPTLSIEDIGLLVAGTAQSLDRQNQQYEGQLGAGRINIGASLTLLTNGQRPDTTTNPP
jgi:subtilisin family serine protease